MDPAPPDLTGQEVAELLDLQPLPGEGGLFRRTHVDAHSSAIYYLLITPARSALHALTATETYHWYAGSPLRLLLLGPGGAIDEPVLGPGLATGDRPQIQVPAGTWQGSTSAGAWTLVGTTTAPPFEWTSFRLGDRAELLDAWPAAATRIMELTSGATPPAGSARTARRRDR